MIARASSSTQSETFKLRFNEADQQICLGRSSDQTSKWTCSGRNGRWLLHWAISGFADAYFIGVVDPEVARRQREGDLTRQRRSFELHLRLQPSLLVWYRALGSVLPGRVTFSFPEAALAPNRVDRTARYNLKLFEAALALLPHPDGDGG